MAIRQCVQALVNAGAEVGASNSEGHATLPPPRVGMRRWRGCCSLPAPRERWAPMARVRLRLLPNNGHVGAARAQQGDRGVGVLPVDNKDCKAWATAECEKRG